MTLRNREYSLFKLNAAIEVHVLVMSKPRSLVYFERECVM